VIGLFTVVVCCVTGLGCFMKFVSYCACFCLGEYPNSVAYCLMLVSFLLFIFD